MSTVCQHDRLRPTVIVVFALRQPVGDVFSDALAKVRGLLLLFKGNELSETDMARRVLAGG